MKTGLGFFFDNSYVENFRKRTIALSMKPSLQLCKAMAIHNRTSEVPSKTNNFHQTFSDPVARVGLFFSVRIQLQDPTPHPLSDGGNNVVKCLLHVLIDAQRQCANTLGVTILCLEYILATLWTLTFCAIWPVHVFSEKMSKPHARMDTPNHPTQARQ